MIIAIDTNIILDILLQENPFYSQSKELIDKYGHEALIISPIVYAELLTQFIKRFSTNAEQELSKTMHDFGISVVALTREDIVLAAEAWHTFIRTKKTEINCPRCGVSNDINCKHCGQKLKWRNHILTDFLIGAHAVNHAEILLSRDKGFYRNYFTIEIDG